MLISLNLVLANKLPHGSRIYGNKVSVQYYGVSIQVAYIHATALRRTLVCMLLLITACALELTHRNSVRLTTIGMCWEACHNIKQKVHEMLMTSRVHDCGEKYRQRLPIVQ